MTDQAATDEAAPAPFQFADGESYERFMGRWSRRAGEQFIDWLEAPRAADWIDIGCGNGAFTETLISRCAPKSVAAVDPSERQLAYARTRRASKLARFERGDAQALSFSERSFDVATMALVIAFLPDAPKAVAEMYRVLRPGGLAATYMWDMPAGGAPVSPMNAAFVALGAPRPVMPGAAWFSTRAMVDLWQGAGFVDVESCTIRIPVEYADFDDFWTANIAKGSPVHAVVVALADEKRRQLQDRLRASLPTAADGRIAYESFANAVKGRKPR
ncbi:MAG: methyltransferase domain-containing protein [Hyphomicrobiales bacterium]|nr:methyltransferase domain-containing protein [Hyphomicrobiales bacterium]